MLQKMDVQKKLVISFILTGVLPVIIMSVFCITSYQNILQMLDGYQEEAVAAIQRMKVMIIVIAMLFVVLNTTISLFVSRTVLMKVFGQNDLYNQELSQLSKQEKINKYEKLMQEAVERQDFEMAAFYRDKIRMLNNQGF